MKRLIIFISSIVFAINAIAQSASEALLLSQYYAGGTARSVGMSGAFGALGGDLSVLSANPAGLAVFRGSEFTFTPALNFTSTDATYNSIIYNDKNTKFIINNIGYVYTKNFYNQKGLQSLSFGVAYNRLSDFNSNAYIRNPDATSSMLDEFVYYANGAESGYPVSHDRLDPFYENLAYNTYAIDIDNNGVYFSDYNRLGYHQPLYRAMHTRGGIGEYDLSLGLNFNHKLFFGATLGIQDIHYEEYYFHEEKPMFVDMEYFNFSEEYSVIGMGLNFKAGLIYRPIQMLRLGAAIHTPTYLWLKPYLFTRMDTSFGNSPNSDGDTYFSDDAESDPSERYQVKSPWRYNVSAAVLLGNVGLIDLDVEFVDYSQCDVFPKSDYSAANDKIASIYKSTVNIKGGVEYRLGPVYLRGGVAYYGNPYNKDQFSSEIRNTLKGTISYSGGIGFRLRNFYMDAAYSYMKHSERINDLYLSYNDQES